MQDRLMKLKANIKTCITELNINITIEQPVFPKTLEKFPVSPILHEPFNDMDILNRSIIDVQSQIKEQEQHMLIIT